MAEDDPFKDVQGYVVLEALRLKELSGSMLNIGIGDVGSMDYLLQSASGGTSGDSGGGGNPGHWLFVHPRCQCYLPHIILRSSMKLSRLYELLPEERLVAVPVEGEYGLSVIKGSLEDVENLQIPDDVIKQYEDGESTENVKHISELVRQLTATVTDLRLERLIGDTFPMHTERQRSYLQYRTFREQLEIKKMSDERDYSYSSLVSQLLRVASLDELSDVARLELVKHPSIKPYIKVAKGLNSMMYLEDDPGYRGDRKVIDDWAELIGLRDVYDWVRVEM